MCFLITFLGCDANTLTWNSQGHRSHQQQQTESRRLRAACRHLGDGAGDPEERQQRSEGQAGPAAVRTGALFLPQEACSAL